MKRWLASGTATVTWRIECDGEVSDVEEAIDSRRVVPTLDDVVGDLDPMTIDIDDVREIEP